MTRRANDNPQPASEIILYQTEDGRNRIEVRLEDESVWLTQNLIAKLYRNYATERKSSPFTLLTRRGKANGGRSSGYVDHEMIAASFAPHRRD